MSSPSLNVSPAQQRFLVWFSPLANIATNVVTPLVVYLQLKHKPIDESYKKTILMQEVARQVISAGIGLISYSSGAGLARLAMKNVKPLQQFAERSAFSLLKNTVAPKLNHLRSACEKSTNIAFGQIIGGTLSSFMGYAFLRPLISTEVITAWLQQHNMIQPLTPSATSNSHLPYPMTLQNTVQYSGAPSNISPEIRFRQGKPQQTNHYLPRPSSPICTFGGR